MKKFILILMVCLMSFGTVFAQAPISTKRVVRIIKIKHISPKLLALILNGETTYSTPSEPINK